MREALRVALWKPLKTVNSEKIIEKARKCRFWKLVISCEQIYKLILWFKVSPK